MSTFLGLISGCMDPLSVRSSMLPVYVCAVSEQLGRVVLAWNNFGQLIDTRDAYMYCTIEHCTDKQAKTDA